RPEFVSWRRTLGGSIQQYVTDGRNALLIVDGFAATFTVAWCGRRPVNGSERNSADGNAADHRSGARSHAEAVEDVPCGALLPILPWTYGEAPDCSQGCDVLQQLRAWNC